MADVATEHGERLAKLEQRVDDLDKRVGDVGAVAVAVGVLTERLGSVADDVRAVNTSLTSEVAARNARENEIRKERRDMRIALWTIAAMILAAIIGAAALVATTVL